MANEPKYFDRISSILLKKPEFPKGKEVTEDAQVDAIFSLAKGAGRSVKRTARFVARKYRQARHFQHMQKAPLDRPNELGYHAGENLFYGKTHGHAIEPQSPKELRKHFVNNLGYKPHEAEAVITHHMARPFDHPPSKSAEHTAPRDPVEVLKTPVSLPKGAPKPPPAPDHEKIAYHIGRAVEYAELHDKTDPNDWVPVKNGPAETRRNLIRQKIVHHRDQAKKFGYVHTDEKMQHYLDMYEKNKHTNLGSE